MMSPALRINASDSIVGANALMVVVPFPTGTNKCTQAVDGLSPLVVSRHALQNFSSEPLYHGIDYGRFALKVVVEAALGDAQFRNKRIEAGCLVTALNNQSPGSGDDVLTALAGSARALFWRILVPIDLSSGLIHEPSLVQNRPPV